MGAKFQISRIGSSGRIGKLLCDDGEERFVPDAPEFITVDEEIATALASQPDLKITPVGAPKPAPAAPVVPGGPVNVND